MRGFPGEFFKNIGNDGFWKPFLQDYALLDSLTTTTTTKKTFD